MGRANSRSSKPNQHHLPKVGTAPNEAYEQRARLDETWQMSKGTLLFIGIGVAIVLAVVLYLLLRG